MAFIYLFTEFIPCLAALIKVTKSDNKFKTCTIKAYLKYHFKKKTSIKQSQVKTQIHENNNQNQGRNEVSLREHMTKLKTKNL